MSTRRTLQERMQAHEQRINREKQELAKLRRQVSKQERNKRTKRLIEIGATVEKAFNHEITQDELPDLYNWLVGLRSRGQGY